MAESSSTRSSRRRSVAWADLAPPADDVPEAVERPKRSSAVRQAAAPLEQEGGFKFKKRKTAKAAAPAPAADVAPPAANPTPSEERTTLTSSVPLPTVEEAALPMQPAAGPVAADVPPEPPAVRKPRTSRAASENGARPASATPMPCASTRGATVDEAAAKAVTAPASSAAPSAAEALSAPLPVPQPQPSPTLIGVPRELLYALLDECAAISADAEAMNLPDMERAVAACMSELERVGVQQPTPANEAAAQLREREAQLSARIGEMESAVRQWDEAAQQATAAAAVPPVADGNWEMAITQATPDEGVLSELPQLPPIEAQLSELGALAGLCAETVDAAMRQVRAVLTTVEGERKQLGKAAHHTAFDGYIHVDQPKKLIKSLLNI